MDTLSPILGAVTGIKPAHWPEILSFSLKVFLFTLPFLAIGFLVERDIVRTPVLSRAVKSVLVFVFFLPVFLFGLLNYLAPGLKDAFWEKYPLLESLWIMEGKWPPLILAGLAFFYLLLYFMETVRGDLTG